MWKEYEGCLQNTSQMLEALNDLKELPPSHIKIVRFGDFNKIFYYENDY